MTTATALRSRPSSAAERIDYLDAAKGFFIIWIITEHHMGGLPSVTRYMYSLGVPSFFLISGMLSAYKREWEQPFGKTAVRKFRSLLYPYITFSIINLLWNLVYYRLLSPYEMPEFSMKQQLLYIVTTYGYHALWFLPSLLWGTLLFLALRRAKRHSLIWAVFSVFLVVFYVLFDTKLSGLGFVSYVYCYLYRISLATVLIYAGSLLFALFRKMNRGQENLLLAVSAVASVIVAAVYLLYPEQFPIANVAVHRMGNPYIYYPAALSGTTFVLLLCKKFLGRSRALTFFGRNSLILMALHMDVTFKIGWWIFPKLPIDFGETVNSLIVIGMELLMFVVIIPVISRYFPFLLRPPKAVKRR